MTTHILLPFVCLSHCNGTALCIRQGSFTIWTRHPENKHKQLKPRARKHQIERVTSAARGGGHPVAAGVRIAAEVHLRVVPDVREIQLLGTPSEIICIGWSNITSTSYTAKCHSKQTNSCMVQTHSNHVCLCFFEA